MLVRNDYDTAFRYLDRATRRTYSWAPGETKEVTEAIGELITSGHPGSMVKVRPEPEESPGDEDTGNGDEQPSEPSGDEGNAEGDAGDGVPVEKPARKPRRSRPRQTGKEG